MGAALLLPWQQALAEADADPTVGAIVLTGAGGYALLGFPVRWRLTILLVALRLVLLVPRPARYRIIGCWWFRWKQFIIKARVGHLSPLVSVK